LNYILAVKVVKKMTTIKDISEMLQNLIEDTTIPKNIRKALTDAKIRLDSNEEKNVKVSAAIYLIDRGSKIL
jgi:uncharacterized protein (UPF0147 family)